MRANFDNKLSELNKKLLSMAAMTEQIIAMSIKSLEEQDTKLARETVEFDAKINEAEREVERICLNLLLQQQPVFAEDLRRVSAALKMITDIERVGDQSADIADLNIQSRHTNGERRYRRLCERRREPRPKGHKL